jgi:large subunit ribosomal protein L10
MSKYVKGLVTGDIKNRLEGVADAILVNVIGMESAATFGIRKKFREKGINMLVIKTSMAARATDGTSLRPMFDRQPGSLAMVWGCEDFVSLAKEVAAIVKSKEFAKFELKGGVMDGEALTPDQVVAISKWPSRTEQISMLVGQILGPGSKLVGQILSGGSNLAGQVKTLIENIEKKEGEA